MAAPAVADAATFTVTNTADSGAGSLRAALNANDANNNQPVVDTILFASGVSGTINAGFFTNRGLYTYEPVDIQGPGANVLTINEAAGAYTYAFFTDQVNAGDPVTISGLTLTGGDPDGSNPLFVDGGGGISNADATLTVRNAVIENNYAVDEGGGIFSPNGDTTIESTTISGNDSDDDGGGIYVLNGDLTVNSSTITSNYAGPGEEAGGIGSTTGDITVSSSTVSGNRSYLNGGGINSRNGVVTVQGSTVSGNYTYLSGTGVFSYYSPTTIQDSTLAGNFTGSFVGGGAVGTLYGGVTVRGSTLSGNETAFGGAVYVYKPYYPSTIQNSTIQGNDAYGGGGVSLGQSNGQPFTIVGSTIAGNGFESGVDGFGGGLFIANPGTPNPSLQDTIVSGNRAASGPDVQGTVDAAFSLIQNPSGATINETVAGSNILGVDPQLGALASNGGPTQTMALASTSPAVDKGSSFGLSSDQRGSPRPSDFQAIANSAAAGADGADIGAFELTAPAFLKCKGKNATIIPRPGLSRKLTGTNKRDIVVGTSAKDTINTKGGNDLVCAKGGKDTVKGGGGKDKLLGQGGKDTLKGGAKKDTLKGGGGKDKLFGQGGKDKLVGGAKNDTCVGGPGKDITKSC